ncbi:MAG TPA: TonB-dependent receptor [Bryobacteraceae bacterium]|nr:TonB-dependent receptor [Bryobacteraceae bacterium]
MRLFLAALALYCALTATAGGQILSSSIVGTATDVSGAVVPHANITVTNESTGVTRGVSADETGAFVFPQLSPGNYQLSAASTGFKKYTVSGISLLVNQTVRVDVLFALGEVTEQVRVTASAVQIESETSSLGQVIESKNIVELPLNGRNFMQLANISTGVAPAYNGRSATITNQSGRADLAVHISGGRGDSNSFLIDGVETRSSWFNSPSVLMSVDAVQEFKIDRNLFSAEYGQGSGIISLVSKSGGNSFHGSAYEFFRNDRLDAANFFDNFFGTRKAPFRQNQYGATAGGAILKNRLFYFGSWEGLRSRRSSTLSAQVPTADQLSGNLAGLASSKRDPETEAAAILDPLTGRAFPGNRIPAARISSVTRNFIKYIPVPNSSTGGRNFVTSKSTNRDDDQFGIRVDYQISSSNSLFTRFTDYQSTLYRPGTGVLSGSVFPYQGKNLVVQQTHLFSSRLLNVFKFGYNYANVFNSWEITPTSIANEIGLKINQVPEEYGLPGVSLSGGIYVGGGAGINQGGIDNLFQFSDSMSWVRGSHTYKFGADIRRVRFDQRLGLSNNGAFSFDDRYTGNSISDFLLGNPASMTAQIGLGVGRWRSNSTNLFLADDWKIASRFTLNAGLRYEYDSPFAERDGREGYFDTSLQKFVVGISREKSPIRRDIPGIEYQPGLRPGIWIPDRNNFAPRVGLAFRASNRTALRAGYGVFYAKTQGNELQFKLNAPPLVFAATLVGAVGQPNLNWDRDAFPDPASPQFPVGTLSPFSVDPRDRSPYIQQWNLNINQGLTDNLLLEVAYAGSKGTKLAERVNINQGVLPGPGNVTPLAVRRPFAGFGDILSSNWQENSNYHALQMRLERRFSGNLSFLLGYTWSHAIDTASRGSGGSWHQNSYRLRDDRGSSDFDVRHRFTGSYIYQFPFGTGKRFLNNSNRLLRTIAGGWSTNGIVTLMTGNLFSVVVSGDRANVGGFPFQRANRRCDGNLARGARTIDRYFDTSCFASTPLGTFGDSGRNIIEIPGLNNWDVSLIKDTRLLETLSLQFRAEFFNGFNHAQFNAPDMNINSAFVGQVRSARDPRISQLALKLVW